MKVLHVIPSISFNRGGPSFAIRAMTRELVRQGVAVEIATTDDDGPQARMAVSLEKPSCENGVTIRYFRRETGFYTVSSPFARWLNKHARDYDVIHIHALFSYTSVIAGRIARRQKVPYIVRPLGVLNRWGMENRRKHLKALSFRFLDKPVAQNAALIHYTSEAEKRAAELSGISAPSIVLPLGLDLEEFAHLPPREEAWRKWLLLRERPVILFLSRIDPIKGLDLLLPAFLQVLAEYPNAILFIGGTGEENFVASLKARAQDLGIAEKIIWAGFVKGHDKLLALVAADVFVLPSYSENFGIAAAEALGAGLPVVISDQVGFAPDVVQTQAGKVTACDESEIAAALSELLGNEGERRVLGERGKQLAHEKYSIAANTRQLRSHYERIQQSI